MLPPRFQPSNEILRLIASIDEFKGEWRVVESIEPERLTSLRRVATIESIGSSTRIEGAKLSDREVVEATGANRHTLKDKFGELVGAGVAELHGKGRGSHYRPVR